MRPAPVRRTAAEAANSTSSAEQWMDRDLGSRAEMEQTFDTGLENVFSEEPAEAASRAAQDARRRPTPSGAAVRRTTAEYNLEAFVAAETTLADHLAEQLTLAISDPVQRMIGRYLIDLVDEAGYIPADLSHVAEKLGASPADVEGVLAIVQKFDPPGICARILERMPRHSAARTRPLRSGDARAGRASRSAGAARLLRRCARSAASTTRISREMIAEIRQLDPKPGLKFSSTRVQAVVPDVYVRPGPDGGWLVELNSDTLPKVLVNQTYYSEARRKPAQGRRQVLFRRLPAERHLAGACTRSARAHDPEGLDRNRAPAGRFLPARRRPSAPAQSEGGRGRDPDARIDRVARDRQQVHGDARAASSN